MTLQVSGKVCVRMGWDVVAREPGDRVQGRETRERGQGSWSQRDKGLLRMERTQTWPVGKWWIIKVNSMLG